MISLQDTPDISISAYSANDCVTDLLPVPGAPKEGFIESVTVFDDHQQKATLKVAFFKGSITGASINSAFTLQSFEDVKKHIKTIELSASNYEDFGSIGSFCRVDGLRINFQVNKGEQLYYQVYTTGTPTYSTTNDLTFEFGILDDGDL